MHEGKYLKDLIERRKLKKKDVAKTLGISPQLLQGYFRSERLQDSTKADIKEKVGIEIKSDMYKNVTETTISNLENVFFPVNLSVTMSQTWGKCQVQ